MANEPLEKRAGRNIGIESLPVFLQAAGAPEVYLNNVPTEPALSSSATLLEAVESALRTPFTRGEESGMCFSSEAAVATLRVYFDDGEGNEMLIATVAISAGSVAPLDLSVNGSEINPFTPSKPLSLCDDEKIIVRASLAAVP